MPFGLGTTELIIILVLAVIVFGPKRLPGIGRSLGKASREFKESVGEIEEVRRGTIGQIDELKDSFKVDLNPLSTRDRPTKLSTRRPAGPSAKPAQGRSAEARPAETQSADSDRDEGTRPA